MVSSRLLVRPGAPPPRASPPVHSSGSRAPSASSVLPATGPVTKRAHYNSSPLKWPSFRRTPTVSLMTLFLDFLKIQLRSHLDRRFQRAVDGAAVGKDAMDALGRLAHRGV